jgi:hypothetical protein
MHNKTLQIKPVTRNRVGLYSKKAGVENVKALGYERYTPEEAREIVSNYIKKYVTNPKNFYCAGAIISDSLIVGYEQEHDAIGMILRGENPNER